MSYSPPNRVIRWPEVHERTGLSRSYVHLLISQGKFPRQFKLGPRASGWQESAVNEWIEERIAASLSDEPIAA
jgi:prophage regulatory protein